MKDNLIMGSKHVIETIPRATALYKYKENTFVLVQCNKLFESRQKKSIQEMQDKSLLELFDLPIALLLADAFYEVYSTGVHKDIRLKHKQHYDVTRLSSGEIIISYK